MHQPMFRETGGPTPGNSRFERASQALIILSMIVMSVATMQSLPAEMKSALLAIDMLIGVGFLIEYVMRIYFAHDRRKYLFSFWGIIDFIAVIPALFLGGTEFKALRAIRLLRLFRLMKLYRSTAALQRLFNAFRNQRYEFAVFGILSALLFYVAAVGIYTFENEAQPDAFPSIPAAMWWAVVTLTTVGYGDVYPVTTGGRIFTGVILLLGLGLIAVPTGLIAAALETGASEKPSLDDAAKTTDGS